MPRLTITANLGPEADATIPVRIVNLDRNVQRKPTVVALNTRRGAYGHELNRGRYLVETVLPNGERVSRTVELATEDDSVDLSPEYRSPRETLSTAVATRQLVDQAVRSDTRDPGPLFFRLLRKGERDWVEAPTFEMNVEWMPPGTAEGIVARVDFSPAPKERVFLAGGPKCPVRAVIVPPFVPMRAVVFPRPQGVATPRGKNDPLCVSMLTLNAAFEGLMSYQIQGQYEAARVISQDVARDLLQSKYMDPVAATGGAYAMLKTGRIVDVLEWLGNLVADFPALPDAFIILSALAQTESVPVQRIRRLRFVRDLVVPSGLSPEETRKVCSVHLLGAAYDAGLPVFTEGLRLHMDVLDMLDDPPEERRFLAASHAIRDVPTFRRRSKPWRWYRTMWRWLSLGKVADWNSRFLTLYLDDPGKVTTRRKYWTTPPTGSLVRPD